MALASNLLFDDVHIPGSHVRCRVIICKVSACPGSFLQVSIPPVTMAYGFQTERRAGPRSYRSTARVQAVSLPLSLSNTMESCCSRGQTPKAVWVFGRRMEHLRARQKLTQAPRQPAASIPLALST